MSAKSAINIEWEGPFAVREALGFKDETRDYEVYQVYGPHPVYGLNVLLYIGKAADQTFGDRLGQESETVFFHTQQCQVRVGRFCGPSTPGDGAWACEMDLAEQLLIYAHSPAYNCQHIQSTPYQEHRDVHVFNWGEYGSLMPEVSGSRWQEAPPKIVAYTWRNQECR